VISMSDNQQQQPQGQSGVWFSDLTIHKKRIQFGFFYKKNYFLFFLNKK
jgi:hypothetical protein